MGVGPREKTDEEQLLDSPGFTKDNDPHNKSSYGFSVALSGKDTDSEKQRLLSQESLNNMEKERSQKTSPTKEDRHGSYTKRMTSEPENSENNLELGIENSDEEDTVFREEEPLSTVMEDETLETSPRQKRPHKKAPRSHLQLHLDTKSASKRGLRIQGLDVGTPGSRGTPKPMNVAVFLKEGEHRLLVLEKGKLTTAEEIKIMMLELLSIPKNAAHLFAIWFISPHLEIQLKPHHVPFILRKQWPHLLTTFSNCQDPIEAAKDEPVLVFQRNSFLRVEEEAKFTEDTIIKRLFEEARYNVLMARYPIPVPEAEMLGGMLARIVEGPYDRAVQKAGCFKKCLQKFLPYYAIGSNKLIEFAKSSKTEQRLIQQYEHATNKFVDVKACQKGFLDYCRDLEFYGCAFFKGVVQQNVKEYKPWKSFEKQVVVGINRVGVSIFKTTKEELIIHIPYDALSWDYLKDESSNCLDSFCIEFDSRKDDISEPVSEQIQVLSRQACMMDAMVDSCINYMNIMNIPKTPTSAEYRKMCSISYSSLPASKKHFSLSRSFKL